ncbi:MAG: hypothetical protein AUG49_02155 [Catenulispora sp. 13_1_20CM_3_70_7]|nr:MAG: hypothetical protein AUG49_02155 [Catenulispora sp. 13_1_20CM_3_70_7]
MGSHVRVGNPGEQFTVLEVHTAAVQARGDRGAQGLGLGDELIEFGEFARRQFAPLSGGAAAGVGGQQPADLGQGEAGPLRAGSSPTLS